MVIVVVIPTYNEAKNIGLLLPAVVCEFKKIPQHTVHVLVVDGSSPDGTAEVVRTQMQTLSNVHLLVEEKKAGLGMAYLNGFRYALRYFNAEVLIEMDADFQHNPKDVLRLIAEIDNGYDYVIGSRFTDGGSIPADWAFYRKFLSVGGNVFSKLVLGIFSVNDFTSGFKATRVQGFLDKINLDAVRSKDFAYKIDLLYRMYKLKAKIKEVPIVFGLRDRGDSKMEKNNFLDSLHVVLSIRLRESHRFIKFLIVGFTGLFVDGSLFNIFRLLLSNSTTAVTISGFTAMLTTFMFNNFWSFGDRPIKGFFKRAVKFGIYISSSLVPIFVRIQLVSAAVSWFGDTFVVSNAAFFIGILFGLVWNFTVYSKIIWRHKKVLV